MKSIGKSPSTPGKWKSLLLPKLSYCAMLGVMPRALVEVQSPTGTDPYIECGDPITEEVADAPEAVE